jgi:DNA repair exonuclease SbcCD ATPase subunit
MSTENEILSEVESLKGRFSDTKALYREVCALLFFRYGITPTTNKLYQYVRKGTMSTPAEALARFWDELRSKARVEIDHPDLPQDLKAIAAEAIAGLWRQATGAARDELASIRLELQAQAEQARQQMLAAQDEAEKSLAELRTQKDESTQSRAELTSLGQELAAKQALVQELQAQLAGAHTQLVQAQEGLHAELAKTHEATQTADARALAAERRALIEIEQERQARAKAEKLAESLRAQLAQTEQQNRKEALGHTEALTRLQVLHDATQSALAQARQAEHQALNERQAAIDALKEREMEVTTLKAETQTLRMVLERAPVPGNIAPSTGKRRRSG